MVLFFSLFFSLPHRLEIFPPTTMMADPEFELHTFGTRCMSAKYRGGFIFVFMPLNYANSLA